MKISGTIIAVFLSLFLINPVFAHPGRTDSSGCHTCRTNCSSWGLGTGEYHCHNAKAAPQPEEPIHSRYGEGGTGYTVPAPEYKYKAPSVESSQPVADTTTSNTNQSGIVLGASDTNDDSGNGWTTAIVLGGIAVAGWWAVRHRQRSQKKS